MASGVVFIVFAGIFFGSSAPFAIPHVQEACGAQPLDMRFHSSADDVNGFLTRCGDIGRDAYRNLQIADLFYPAVFGLFMTSALIFTLGRLLARKAAVLGLAATALAGTVFDYLENIMAWITLTAYPETTAAGSLLGFASAAKTISFWVAGLTLLIGIAALAVKFLTRRSVGPNQIQWAH